MDSEAAQQGAGQVTEGLRSPTRSSFQYELQQALIQDTGFGLEADQLAQASSAEWLAANGSPYPQDSMPSTNLKPKNYRFLCYRWCACWLIEKSRIECEKPLPNKLSLPATRDFCIQ